MELGRPDEALASYDQALALRPDDANTFNNRGSALMALGHAEEALASYDRALAIKPDHAEARDLLQRAVELAGSYGDAAGTPELDLGFPADPFAK